MSKNSFKMGFCFYPTLKMQMQPLNYLKDCLESRRFALDDHHDCALFWCALSGPRNWALRDWSKVWPTLTWLTKLVGVAVSSSIRNKNFTHTIKPATYGRVWDNLLALTHWGRNKMVHVLQTPLPNAFSWIKITVYFNSLLQCLFLRVQLTIRHP